MHRLRSASSLALAPLVVLMACGPRIEKARTVDDAMAPSSASTTNASTTKQMATIASP